jgi:cell division protein FtsI/penicillin-binding protein 2
MFRVLHRHCRVALLLLFAAVSTLSSGATREDRFVEVLKAKLKAEPNAVVVVLDAYSGEVIAGQHLDQAAQVHAAPGSAIKPFTMLALLEAKALKPDEKLFCRRKLKIGGRQLDCTHATPSGALTATEALAFSCNNFFAEAGRRLSGGTLDRIHASYGLRASTNLPARTPEELQLKALGVSGIEVTPQQLAQAYQQLVRTKFSRALHMDEAEVLTGLEQSVDYGRAFDAQTSEMKVAGKTGTALDRKRFRAGWFAGYAPAKEPEIIVVVYAPNVNGARAAGVARRVFEAWSATRKP